MQVYSNDKGYDVNLSSTEIPVFKPRVGGSAIKNKMIEDCALGYSFCFH